MAGIFRRTAWSPYAVGAGIGILSWFAFATVDKAIGITTAFEHTAALAGKVVAPDATGVSYAAPDRKPKIGWEWMLVVGVFIGALFSSKLSGDRPKVWVPELWRQRFGPNRTLRLGAAFLGGAAMMLGARLAGGCTSGHGISGSLQLALSSWVFTPLFFFVAIITALALYGRKGADHV